TLKVYNLLGEEVATLVDEIQVSGFKFEEWNASALPSGVYVCRMTAGSFTTTIKLLLMR
ncbi:MAG: T9SS type A sorting domain-containing protein, partial [Ignavibacteriae bacterium]|nr:T9SS type A sorting domain-containing protein [Ignavibacteriota bacterium]